MRLWPKVQRIFGWDEKGDWSPYMTRIFLWGNYRLQIFHRGDADPDPHDHPSDFWTFPLVSYLEEFYIREGDKFIGPCVRKVKAFRWHLRQAEHCHRVIAPLWGRKRPIVTFVWWGPKIREWGFWVPDGDTRRFVPWREYVGA